MPPPGSGTPDGTPPTVSNVSVSGANGGATVRLTVSERATVNVRFARAEDVTLARCAGASRAPRRSSASCRAGRYVYELWAVDAMGNRSSTHPGEVSVRG